MDDEQDKEHTVEQKASSFLELDRLEAGLVCLLAINGRRVRNNLHTYRGRLGLLVTLWFGHGEVFRREHGRWTRWARCQPNAYDGDLFIALGFGLRDDEVISRLRCR
jgi:hypothetical protein